MQRKGFFNADTVGDLPDGVGGVHCTTLSFDNNTLKDLDTFLAALNDTDVYLDIVARTKIRMILPHLL
jgi:hypothetical protein